ncbi:sulfatase-like hydrolase/transferase [Paenibacillus aurantius]|uniref:Sulfatase-like hydrolase/transferase n=1 Tax=Paenibacillus aurantius TaxID=2918900 RepID=A0AA96LCW0_9BACL|nr:sulfatase-like hydrolase/transferase [Paenibacillus aurantius]WNQ10728.1 sulfatase-like hydrolase/transferase [Paenibacillus aurantius]
MPTAGDRPNILLITSDQQHWNTIGAFNPEIRTPNLDRLVREGTVFTRAYCPNPLCTPSRASIVTGLYPSQHGAWSLGTKLQEEVPTVGDRLQSEGYRTALIGKAHFQPLASTEEYPSIEAYPILQDLTFWRDFHGPFYGFEHVELTRNHTNEAHVGQHYVLWLEENGCANWRDYYLPPTGTMDPAIRHRWDIPERWHYNTWIEERTNAALQRYKDDGEPFFLWSSFFDPHPKYLAPEPWCSMYDPSSLKAPGTREGEHGANPPHFALTQEAKPDFSPYKESGFFSPGLQAHAQTEEQVRRNMATYYGMVSFLDRSVGRILDKLAELGLADNTIVVFTTDHGHLFGQHGLTAKGPFHYEDLLKLPFLVRYPGHVPAGRRTDALQSLVDLAPTFLRLAGINVPRTMAGTDQSEVWTGRTERVRNHIICENRQEPTAMYAKTYVEERYKLTVYYNRPYGELFDLREDPGEFRNLWNDPASQGVRLELMQRLVWAEMGKEPLWMPRIAGA